MSTITAEQEQAIREFVVGHHITEGLGTVKEACSVASINLALTGTLTDRIPDCMSVVVGKWIIGVQDAMPDEMRNSVEWKGLLPLAAGTGRDREQERLDLILDWMWGTVLPVVQPVADEGGFGVEWRAMCEQRTPDAAVVAADAADDFAFASAWAASAWAASATYAAARAAEAAHAAARATNAANAWVTFDPCGLLRKLVS